MQLLMDATSLSEFMAEQFPQVAQDFVVEEVGEELVVRLRVSDEHLRP